MIFFFLTQFWMVSPLQNKLYLYIKRDFDFELLESSDGFKFSFFCLI